MCHKRSPRVPGSIPTRGNFLLPTMNLQQGNVFTPVYHSVHRKSVCLWSRGRGCLPHTPGQIPPSPLGRPPWADTPQADTPWTDNPPGRHTPPAQCMLGYTPPIQCMLGYTPPGQCMLGYSQQAGGTHPTGMHSYLLNLFCPTPYKRLMPTLPESSILGKTQTNCTGIGGTNMVKFIYYGILANTMIFKLK